MESSAGGSFHGKSLWGWFLLVATVVVIIGVVTVWSNRSKEDKNPPVGGGSATDAPKRSGQPWEYDAGTNMYWDPEHRHWHTGQPPSLPGTIPEPRSYDAGQDRYWDLSHNHWHQGKPSSPSSPR